MNTHIAIAVVLFVAASAVLVACVVPQPAGTDPSAASGDGCDRACARYARCRGVADPAFGDNCAAACSDSNPDPASLEQAATGDCPTVIGLFEGPAGAAPAGAAPASDPAYPVGGPAAPAGTPIAQAPSAAGASCPAPKGSGAQDAQIVQMITSSAWCHFSYSGSTTRNEKVVMSADGRVSMTGDSETSRSGDLRDQYGDQTATYGAGSQSNNAASGCWKVDGGALLLSNDGATWANANATVAYNSNNYPIVTANGKEYSQCN